MRGNWQAAYGGAANAQRVAILEEGMSYKAISLPPEDNQVSFYLSIWCG
ncbi:hypothetical protein [Enterococcus faecium]